MKNSNLKHFKITSDDEGQRLDNFLSDNLELSRNQIQNLIKKNDILCNTNKTKSSYLLKSNDDVTIDFEYFNQEDFKLYNDSSIDIEIVFEDSDIIVVNKPAGLVTHPGAGSEKKSVVHAVFDKLPTQTEDPLRPGVVHRLDKDTQGLLVLAKNIESQKNLSEQFKSKTAKRTYRALCFGRFKLDKGTYETHLKRDPKNRKKYKSQEDGKLAVTHFKVLKENEISYVELNLETGRTHQIRVHLSENQHPIINDQVYGHEKRLKEIKDISLRSFLKELKNMPLVATNLEFTHPRSDELQRFSIPWPSEFIYENLSD